MLLQGYYESDIRVRRKAEALVASGYEVDVLALRSSHSKAPQYTLNGVSVSTLSLGKKRGSLARYLYEYLAFFVWVAVKLPGLMRRRRYAAIDVNTLPDFLIFAAFYARWKRAKLVLDMHEITPEFYTSKYKVAPDSWLIRFLRWVETASMSYADHVITINQPIQDLLESRGLPPGKSTIIMNTADEGLFAASSRSPVAAASDASKPAFVMMYHGTLTKIYGLDIAIAGLHRAHDRMPAAELWILGDGPERGALQQLAESFNLADRVKFIGSVLPQDVHHWLRQCDVGVLATRQDVFLDYSFSNKLSEYIIMGKAVIAARLRTIRHYFSEDALAYFAPEDPAALAERMIQLYGDRSLRESLARNSAMQLRPIRWEVMRARYLKTIDEIVQRDAKAVRLQGP